MEELLTAIRATDSSSTDGRTFKKEHLSVFKKEILPTLSADKYEEVEELILTCIDRGYEYVMEVAVLILKRRNLIDFKAHPETVDKVLDMLAGLAEPMEDHNNQYHDFMEAFMKQLKQAGLVKQFGDKLFAVLTLAIIDKDNNRLLYVALQIAIGYAWKEDVAMAKRTLEALYETVKEYSTLPASDFQSSVAINAMTMALVFTAIGPSPEDVAEVVGQILDFCMVQEWYDVEDSSELTISYKFVQVILSSYVRTCAQNKTVLQHTIKHVKTLKNCGVDELEGDANRILGEVGNMVSFERQEVEQTLDAFLEHYDVQLMTQVINMYDDDPTTYHNRLGDLETALRKLDIWKRMSLLSLFLKIAKANPRVFTKSSIELVVEYSSDAQIGQLSLLVLKELAKARAVDLIEHEDTIMGLMMVNPLNSVHIAEMLIHMAACSEEKIPKYVDFLAGNVRRCDVNTQASFLGQMVTLCQNHPEVLARHRQLLEDLKTNPALKTVCEGGINFLEGRSLEAFSEHLAGQKQTLDSMGRKMDDTVDNIGQLEENVHQTKKEVDHVKEDVDKTAKRLDDVEEAVDEVEEKVDELDHKTLSHAPRWSRDVSKLLNPEDEHDWRLLAGRLGYSADDVKNWATQADPCMSMLDEWFATHKTSEATHAILKSLEEMDRTDAAEIVGRALASVDDIIDEDPPELTNPPPIFISYQWGHQAEAKLLKKHLGMAGYDAWMDIGQMGGGDKLFAKIDEGVRAAKVIICCVTEKYAKSPNCNREVNLSTTLGKPIIPLLMEKMQWPPAGSMGPIFGEYLFIRFFQRDNSEVTKDERYWPKDKFQELLLQMRYSIPPDVSKLAKQYKDWWSPPAEVIAIKPKVNRAPEKGQLRLTGYNSPETSSSPDIFISYQWGKQPQIKVLYKRLTSLGYSCWFDIMQMGGGDSLYDKIDKGVRGCHVMLSCVTTKYSKSANCRREVSLADAIKKPIIPLLLEDMSWPPEGPMGMVFTQLLYIGFIDPSVDVQDHWQCPQFEELLNQLTPRIPENRVTHDHHKPRPRAQHVQAKGVPNTVDIHDAQSVSVCCSIA